jgi:hypothetical protein
MEGLPLDILGSRINILLFAKSLNTNHYKMLSMISESNLAKCKRGLLSVGKGTEKVV